MTLQTYLTLIQWNIQGILKNVVTKSFDIPLIYKKKYIKMFLVNLPSSLM